MHTAVLRIAGIVYGLGGLQSLRGVDLEGQISDRSQHQRCVTRFQNKVWSIVADILMYVLHVHKDIAVLRHSCGC